ncbi:hypothetical protein BYT27DRAFT_7271597 [Phlegmacium glaucopus]|nr:hypothetical protein BYT27DRAFT_7271597 [Phlegmacium glaucopus]
MGLEDGQASEHSEWVENGHGQHCFMPIAVLEHTGFQTDPPLIPVPTTTSISVQTDVVSAPLASSATMAIQTDPLAPIFDATSQNEPPFDEYEAKVNINTSNDVFCKPATIYDDASTQTTSPTFQYLEIASPAPNDASQSPAMPEKEISARLGAKRERSSFVTVSRSLTPSLAVSEPLAPHAIVSAPEAAEIVQKHPESRKSHVSTQKHPETSKTAVSTRFSWADDAEALPIVSTTPTKYPRDLSGLRSSSTNPFSSLRRRHRKQAQNPRNSYHFHHSQPRHTHYQHFNSLHSNPHPPHQISQPTSFISLNWDQDPRLLDLSNALKALGWICNEDVALLEGGTWNGGYFLGIT